MEKVFAGDRDREKFDLTRFRDDDNSRKNSKFSDQAYDCKYIFLISRIIFFKKNQEITIITFQKAL